RLDALARGGLSDGTIVRTCVFEFMLPRRVRRRSVAPNKLALGVKLQQLVGHIAHRALCLGFCFLPAYATEPVERRRGRLARRISRNEVHALDGDEQLSVIGIYE